MEQKYVDQDLNAVVITDEERTQCEIWTRVMGFYRTVSAFNKGKKSEYDERKEFREKDGCCLNCGSCFGEDA